MNFFKGPEPIFQDQEPSQNSRYILVFSVLNKDMSLLIVKPASL